MRFIDTHCHFDFPPFQGDERNSLCLADAAGVKAMVVVATEAATFPRLLSLIDQHDELYGALGLHPLWGAQHRTEHLAIIESQLQRNPKIVALGEMGLDFFTPELQSTSRQQERFLAQQFELAIQYHLPVILHSRRAHDRLARLLRQARLPAGGVIHGFSGSYQQAQRLVDLGYFIGVGGTISYSRANKTRQAIAQLPLQALVLETDAPDMPLAGYQGQPNRPEQVARVYQSLCQLRTEPASTIAETLWNNSLRLFPRLSLTSYPPPQNR